MPTMSTIPDGSDKYIDKKIENDISEGEHQIQVNETSKIKQISGCTFHNIAVNKNFFIRIDQEIPFFNNVIENDNINVGPSVMWVNSDIKFVISRCKFIKCNGRTTDGNILTANTNNEVHVTFEYCEFIDCSINSKKVLVNFLDKRVDESESSANFTECIFKFNDATLGCRVLDSVGEVCVFESVFAYLTINNLFFLVKVVKKLAKIVDLKLKIYKIYNKDKSFLTF